MKDLKPLVEEIYSRWAKNKNEDCELAEILLHIIDELRRLERMIEAGPDPRLLSNYAH